MLPCCSAKVPYPTARSDYPAAWRPLSEHPELRPAPWTPALEDLWFCPDCGGVRRLRSDPRSAGLLECDELSPDVVSLLGRDVSFASLVDATLVSRGVMHALYVDVAGRRLAADAAPQAQMDVLTRRLSSEAISAFGAAVLLRLLLAVLRCAADRANEGSGNRVSSALELSRLVQVLLAPVRAESSFGGCLGAGEQMTLRALTRNVAQVLLDAPAAFDLSDIHRRELSSLVSPAQTVARAARQIGEFLAEETPSDADWRDFHVAVYELSQAVKFWGAPMPVEALVLLVSARELIMRADIEEPTRRALIDLFDDFLRQRRYRDRLPSAVRASLLRALGLPQ